MIKDIGNASKLAINITIIPKNGLITKPTTNINFISPPPNVSFLNIRFPSNMIPYINPNKTIPEKIWKSDEIDYIDAYIEDIKNNDFSLLEFPLPLLNLNGKESSIKGFIVGLIKSVKQCISKNNRIFYRIELVTRDKLITQLMGQTEYESFKDMIRPWRFIMYTGDEDQQYGGLHRRSGICNARKIVEIGAAILLKDQNRLTEQNEKSILQYMKSKNNILSSNELYNYLISDVIEQLNNPKKPKNPDFLK